MEEVNKIKVFCNTPNEDTLNDLSEYTIKFIQNAAEFSLCIKTGNLPLARKIMRIVESSSFKIIEINNERDLGPYISSIKKYMNECFDTDNYSTFVGKWIIITDSTDNILGFINIDRRNVIWNVCTTQKYRGKGVAAKAIRYAIKFSCGQNKNPQLLVDKLGDHYSKLVPYYKSIGFKVVPDNPVYKNSLIMKYNC